MKLMDVINENRKVSYGCVMLYFDFPEIKNLHTKINNEDVYNDPSDPSYGLEDEPHTTLLYGLHPEVTDENVKEVLDKHKFGPCQISNASLFENENYDVLKFDVSGDSLHECNADLREYPYTTNFPDYHPHLTIGYLKPGTGKNYTKLLEGQQYTLEPKYAVYSKTDGTKSKFKLK
jgi:hypothetical protein